MRPKPSAVLLRRSQATRQGRPIRNRPSFGYAAHRGVPFLLLTDGRVWEFYLSMADGIPADRRFYRIELDQDERIPEYASFLELYLKRDRVSLHETQLAAGQLRDGDRQKEKARNTIPKVWNNLLATGDETLRDLIVDIVEGECGTRPELDDVEEFLKSVYSSVSQPLSPALPTHGPPSNSPKSNLQKDVETLKRPKKIVGFTLDGRRTDSRSGIQTLADIIKELDKRNPHFMEQFAEKTKSRTRRLVSQDRANLYDRADLVAKSMPLGNGWFLGTNISSDVIRKGIGTACAVAGVNFGSQLTLVES